MVELLPGWSVELDRGPDWLIVHFNLPGCDPSSNEIPFAEALWRLMQQQFAHRLVLELDEVPALPSYCLGQLVVLYKRIHQQGGLLRLCGLSHRNQELIRLSQLEKSFPAYADRSEAVMGHRPQKPR